MSTLGILYIVATPIGHLGDITYRALEVLNLVDYIAVEDTRHSQPFLKHFAIQKPLFALHDHNEKEKALKCVADLQAGKQIALISDAGTPLISDPGYQLVRLAQQQGVPVVPIPGACSVIAALSASGLPTHKFQFEGFLPAKPLAREKALSQLKEVERTLIFFEAPHRISHTIEAMRVAFGDDREAVIARELTKRFETIRRDALANLASWVAADPDQQRGELVILVAGKPVALQERILTAEVERLVQILLEELSVKQAVSLAAKISGVRRGLLYDYALTL